jgi:hypothetical protein
MRTSLCPGYADKRFPTEVISHNVCLYCRFSRRLRIASELLVAHGIAGSYGPCTSRVEVGTEVYKANPAQAARRRQVLPERGRDHDFNGKVLLVERTLALIGWRPSDGI